MNTIPIFAHRGASSIFLENTFSAFKKAKDLGADGVELDIQISKDAILMVFHDLNLRRLAGVRKLVTDCDYEELISYNLGPRFKRFFRRERMMAFQEVIDWANQENIALNVELKESLLTNQQALRQFLETIHLPENSHFSSFYEPLLKVVKETNPQFETALIVTRKFDWTKLADRTFYDVVHAHKKYYKRQYLKYCDEANIGIRFYGIDGKEAFLKSPHSAVIGWITDFPDKVRKIQK